MMVQNAFFYDQSRCYACGTCSVSCKNKHGVGPGPVKWLRIFQWETGSFPDQRLNALFAPCYHCETPKCVAACPTQAIYKDEKFGAVLVDSQLCDGCRDCFEACDYGAPQFADDTAGTKMSKCTMCIDRLDEGLMPLCTTACPMRALDFGPLDVINEKYGNLRELDDMPRAETSVPSVVFKPKAGRKMLVGYSSQRSLELLGQRGDLKPLYSDTAAVTDTSGNAIRKNKLNMKAISSDERVYFTQSDEA